MANHPCYSAKKTDMSKANTSKVIVADGESLRPESDLKDTGEEQDGVSKVPGSNDAAGPKPKGSPTADRIREQRLNLSCKQRLKLGTWNVRSMQSGKMDVIQGEMKRLGIAIMGLSETRWKGQGHFNWNGYRIIMSGQKKGRNGVAIMCDMTSANAIMGYDTVSDRLLSVRFKGKNVNITVVQVYAPTSTAGEEDQESFYNDLQSIIDRTPKGDVVVVIGDFNAKVGKHTGGKGDTIGGHGLGEQNEAGERLVEFCDGNSLRIMNTWFEQPKRRLYTWTTPDGKHKNQIDYILINKRWKSTIRDVRTKPGADCGTDHELLVATLQTKLKRLHKGERLNAYDCKDITPEYRLEIRNRFEILERDEAESEAETEENKLWEKMKREILETAEKYIPKKRKGKTTPWLSKEAITIAADRREAKRQRDKKKVRETNRAFQKQARVDREKHLNDMCKEMEEEGKKGRTKTMFAKVREITRKATPRMGSLKAREGHIIADGEEIKNRWKEYTEELYSEDKRVKKEFVDVTEFEKEPEVMEAEVEWAIKQLKDNKAPGQDGIPIELIKAGDDAMIKTITKICNNIWTTGKWPDDWKSSVFIPIFKKGDAKECENYRTIAMISHTSKILLKIIHKRMESTIERELPNNQAGFRKSRGTRDHIANMRWIMERQREHGQRVYICFIDYSKAFDCINHDLMWKTLDEMGIPKHLIHLLKGLYEDQIAVIRTEHGDTDRIKIKKGVRQGCILSPVLFNLYAERIMRMAGLVEAEEEKGVRIAGRTLNNLRYADDTTLLAGKKNDLVEMIRRLKKESEKAGLYFNMKKTKIMSTGEEDSFEVDGEELETVTTFTFLGSVIEREGKCDMEIKRRVALGKTAMNGMEKIWKDKNVRIDTKKRLVRALIIPIITYGSESWTMTKKMEKKINACEMWIWRKMLRISWTEKRTNDWVRKTADIVEDESLLQSMLRARLRFFGHVMRSNGLEKEMMLACGEGCRKQGRPRKRWMDTIHETTGMNLADLRDATVDRVKWRGLVVSVARTQRVDSTR